MLSKLFMDHGIGRVSVWMEYNQVVSFIAEDSFLENIYLSDAVYEALEKEALEFLKTETCFGYNVFEFARSRGVVYIKDGQPSYCGDVAIGEEMLPFSEQWLDEEEIELMIYDAK